MTKGHNTDVWEEPGGQSRKSIPSTDLDIDSGDSKSPLSRDQSSDIEHRYPNAFAASTFSVFAPDERHEDLTNTPVRLKDTRDYDTDPQVVYPSEDPEYLTKTVGRRKDTPGSNTEPDFVHPSERPGDLTTDSDTDSLLSDSSSEPDQQQESLPTKDSDANRYRLALADDLRVGFRVVTNRGSAADIERMKHMDPRLNLLILGFQDYRDKTGVVPEGQPVDLWSAWVHARGFADSEMLRRRELVHRAFHITYDDVLDALAPPAYDHTGPPPYLLDQAGSVQSLNRPNMSLPVRQPEPIKMVEPDVVPLFLSGQLAWNTILQAYTRRPKAPNASHGTVASKLAWFDRVYQILLDMFMYS
ncbi:hypothetical protein CALCODRAFT_478937 [Calocera cornea HHB12733]|uniref:Uncharacterized protein n=1 Tax=Calocera cornea HHB12733 TaxID=1353952 RepID=A0A165K3R6_9BASI|nr:hypothetical protein CALCODRAFT_478937 [Calocera cornea HHB12733]